MISRTLSVKNDPVAMKLCWPESVYFPSMECRKDSSARASRLARGLTAAGNGFAPALWAAASINTIETSALMGVLRAGPPRVVATASRT